MMPSTFPLFRACLLLAALLSITPQALAQRVSARDREAIEALDQRMAAAEKRYRDALGMKPLDPPLRAAQ